MKLRLFLLLLCVITLSIFTIFSYYVAKERFIKSDFDTTVKLQDHISRKFDLPFSYFTLLGSVEVTIGLCFILAVLFLIRGKWIAFLGWMMIIPASMGEIFGKLVLFHPSPPVLLHRTILPTNLPAFYIHTNFSYPSGHMTRTFFIITIISILVLASKLNSFSKFILLGLFLIFMFMMTLTRVYLGEHWLSDVIGGTLLGIGMGFFATILILPKKKV